MMSSQNLRNHCRSLNLHYSPVHVSSVRFAPTETYIHKRLKFEVANAISMSGGTYATEYPIVDLQGIKRGEVDVVWFEENMAIEFESKPRAHTERQKAEQYYPLNLLFFDLSKFRNQEEAVNAVLSKIGLAKEYKVPSPFPEHE